MSKAQQLQRVLDAGIVAVVRALDPAGLVEAIRALADGGDYNGLFSGTG